MFPLAFGFGSPADIAIILVFALIIFGPKKLPELGKQIGEAMRDFRKITDEFTGTAHSVRTEVESVYKPVLSSPSIYQPTSSATVEQVMKHKPYDQEPENLMAPIVLHEPKSETLASQDEDVKGQ